jgi:accessory gene regulator B
MITFRYVKLFAYKSTIYLLKKICGSQKESITEQTRLYKKHAMYSGFQFIYGLLNKGLLLIVTGLLLGILPQLLLTTLFFSLLKVFAGGLHFDSYVKCTYFSLLMFSIVAYLSKYIYINTPLTIIIFASVFVLFILVAPVDLEPVTIKVMLP